MSEHLNAALAAISLLEPNEESKSEMEGFWQARAVEQVLNALNLHNAWSSLIRYKMGESLMPQQTRQFQANDLLRWLSRELQLDDTPQSPKDVTLSGNRETLQEALLLLRSCAQMLGPNVHLFAQNHEDGMWFRVRYDTLKPPPPTVEDLIASLGRNWRARSTAFELARAKDFLAINGCELLYQISKEGYCEMAFFIPAVGKKAKTSPHLAQLQTSPYVVVQPANRSTTITFNDNEPETVKVSAQSDE